VPAADVDAGAYAPLDEEDSLFLLVPDAAGIEYTLDDGMAPPSRGAVAEDGVLVHRITPGAEGATIRFANRTAPVVLFFKQDGGEQDGLAGDDDEYDEDLDEDEDADEFPAADAGADLFPDLRRADLAYAEDDDYLDDDDFADEEEGLDALDEAYADEFAEETAGADLETVNARMGEDDSPALTLLVPEKANVAYTFVDSTGSTSQGRVAEDGMVIIPIAPAAAGGSLKFDDETEAIEFSFAAD
jgi:hypothetical protein